MAVSEEQRAKNHARQVQRGQRRLAREMAAKQAAGELDRLLEADPPDGFSVEQANAFRDQLLLYRSRIGGAAARAPSSV